MKNRYMPFGYEISDGQIQIKTQEQKIIELIYTRYISGNSFNEIASMLSHQEVAYRQNAEKWNKSMVKRIIENPKYVGENDYPKVISAELYNQANILKEKKSSKANLKPNMLARTVKNKVVCEKCGSTIKRERVGNNRHRATYWRCSNTECELTNLRLTDEMLENKLNSRIDEVTSDEECVEIKCENTVPQSLEIMKLTNEIYNQITNGDSEDQDIAKMILNCAAIKYESCVCNNWHRTEKIKELIREKKPQNLMDEIVKTIYITPTGAVKIQLINEKIF